MYFVKIHVTSEQLRLPDNVERSKSVRKQFALALKM